HYSVSYRLHGPEGVLEITELGEAFQQYGRELLRGYLMSGGQPESEQDLRVQNARLRAALQQHEQAQDEHIEHMLRSRTQQNLIVRLARHRYGSANPQQEAAQLITQAACEVYELGRATIWHLNGTRLEPVACYRLDGDHYETPPALELAPYPRYLQALQSGRAIDAQDVGQDHRTCELDECVYRPQAIRSILDASIRVGGEVIGVLSLQHSGKPRAWHADEIAFAGELADQYAQVLANQQRLSATHMLGLFQRAVEQSASAFILVDRDGRVEYVNPAFTAISQFSESEVRGQRLADLKALENLGELLFDTSSVLAHSNSWQGEFRSRRKNLEPYWGQLSISKVFNDDGMLTHYIGIYEDITRSKLAHQHIERLAYTDNLTNLGNRPFFIRSIEERFAAGAEPRLC
ncbi:TPA: GAF domain-containing protein, partial [Escherichia coli]